MKKWIVHFDAGMAGTDQYESCEAETAEEAELMFNEEMHQWFDAFDQLDGLDASDEGYDDAVQEMEERRSEISCSAEEYDPKEHEGHRINNSKWAWE